MPTGRRTQRRAAPHLCWIELGEAIELLKSSSNRGVCRLLLTDNDQSYPAGRRIASTERRGSLVEHAVAHLG